MSCYPERARDKFAVDSMYDTRLVVTMVEAQVREKEEKDTQLCARGLSQPDGRGKWQICNKVDCKRSDPSCLKNVFSLKISACFVLSN